jgi:hypothetical protein
MATSQTDTILFDPDGNSPIDASSRMYFGGLARHFGHELLLEAFERSGLSKADLAVRLGYDPSRLGRILNTPANLTLETFGEVLFAIDGSCAHFSQRWPLGDEPRNYEGPDWLSSSGRYSMSVSAGQSPSAVYHMAGTAVLAPSTSSGSITVTTAKVKAA